VFRAAGSKFRARSARASRSPAAARDTLMGVDARARSGMGLLIRERRGLLRPPRFRLQRWNGLRDSAKTGVSIRRLQPQYGIRMSNRRCRMVMEDEGKVVRLDKT